MAYEKASLGNSRKVGFGEWMVNILLLDCLLWRKDVEGSSSD